MNCQEALSLLYEIIDKEASEIEINEVQRHRERCQHCFEVYRVETAIQDFINEKLKDGNPSGSLEALKAKVSLKLDEIDGQQTAKENRPFFRRTAAVLAAAASLVILIGGAFFLRDLYWHQTEYLPLEQAHVAIADDPTVFVNDAGTFSTILRVRSELGYDVSASVHGFSLIGGQHEEIMGVTMAHFVYSHGNGIVSVFVAPSEQFEISNDLKDGLIVRNQIIFFDHYCRGCHLVFHRAGPAVVVTATTDHSIELLDFVPGHTII